MRKQVIYISDDGVEFAAEEKCSEYEEAMKEFLADEKECFGEDPEYVGMTRSEIQVRPVLESYAHNAEDVIAMAKKVIDFIRGAVYGSEYAMNAVGQYIEKACASSGYESAGQWRNAVAKLDREVAAVMQNFGASNYNRGRCWLGRAIKRLGNTSPSSGIEYPDAKWLACEQDFERYVKDQKAYKDAGFKYTD